MTEQANSRSLALVSAHAADFCIRAGGTLARYAAAGWRVEVICLSYGERGESDPCWFAGMKEPEVKRTRRKEAEAAAAVLNVGISFADWGDQPLRATAEGVAQLVSWFRDAKPAILLSHFSSDIWNPDHEAASIVASQACYYATCAGVPGGNPVAMPRVFQFEPTWPFAQESRFVPNVYIDVTEVMDVKREAMKELTSQPEMCERYTEHARVRAKEAGRGSPGGPAHAEAFYSLIPWVGCYLPMPAEEDNRGEQRIGHS